MLKDPRAGNINHVIKSVRAVVECQDIGLATLSFEQSSERFDDESRADDHLFRIPATGLSSGSVLAHSRRNLLTFHARRFVLYLQR